MGVMHHNAVIATVFNQDYFNDMKKWIEELEVEKTFVGLDPKKLFIFGGGIANDYHTIVLVPDGSKEGWPDSDVGDKLREVFIAKLNSMAYDDGSSCWRWIEVGFGEIGQEIIQGNNQNEYA